MKHWIILMDWVFQETATAPLWNTDKTMMKGQMPMTQEYAEDNPPGFHVNLCNLCFVFCSVFHRMVMLICFCLHNGFPHVSLLFLSIFTSGFKGGYILMPHYFPIHLVKREIWFATFFCVSGGIFLVLCTLHSKLNLIKMPQTLYWLIY